MVYYIYRITNTKNDKCYIGSTRQQLEHRRRQHFYSYNRFKKYGTNCCRSFVLIDEDTKENIKIELLEEINTDDIKTARTRERFHIQNNNCVNIIQPTRTNREWANDNREKVKEIGKRYREKNKEKIKLYRDANKERKALVNKLYRDANKERIRQRDKLYYQKNKERIKKRSMENYYSKKGNTSTL